MRWGIICVAAMACVLAGCGNDSQPGSASPAESNEQTATEQVSSEEIPDPCSLLTADDIQKTLGMQVGEVEGPKPLDTDPDGLLCHWNLQTDGYGERITLSIHSRANYCDQYREVALELGRQVTAVDGLGATASWHESASQQDICVNDGDVNFVLFSVIDPPVGQAGVVALAKIVLSRI